MPLGKQMGNRTEKWLQETSERVENTIDLFDPDETGFVGKDQIAIIFRSLGINANEEDMIQLLMNMQTQEGNTEMIPYEEVEKTAMELLDLEKYGPDSPALLLKAFQVLDPEKRGYIDAELMEEMLRTQDSFFDKEVESFMSIAKDSKTSRIYYEDYVSLYTKLKW